MRMVDIFYWNNSQELIKKVLPGNADSAEIQASTSISRNNNKAHFAEANLIT
jgi:hypothetical protein